MKKEICQNCEREIGKLEQAYIFKGQVVCSQCNEILGNKNPVQTIEQTSKLFKGIMLIGMVVIAMGLYIAWKTLEIETGMTWAFIGVATFLFGKIGGWWYHG